MYDELEIVSLRRKDDFDRDITLAWHIEALRRTDKLPSLKNVLSQRVRRQTPRQMRAALNTLSEQYGIPLRKVIRQKNPTEPTESHGR